MEKDISIKREFLLNHFHEIIDKQWREDKKMKSRREFLDCYFGIDSPSSDDTLSKWRKNEPKKEEEKLRLLPYLEKMSVAKVLFNEYYFEDIWKKHFGYQLGKSFGKGEALEVAMLSNEYFLNSILLHAMRRLSYVIRNEVKESLDKKQEYLVRNIYDFDVKSRSQILNKSIIDEISKEINSSEKGQEFTYEYPTKMEIYKRVLSYLGDEVDYYEANLERNFELDVLGVDANYREWNFYRKKYRGLKHHRLNTQKQFEKKRGIVSGIRLSNIYFWKKCVVSKKSVSRKVSVEVVYAVQGKMEEFDNSVKDKIFLHLIYNGKTADIDYSINNSPTFSRKKVRKSISKKLTNQMLAATSKLRRRAIRCYFLVNVTAKKRDLRIKKNKLILTDYQRKYNHFEIKESFEKRSRKTPHLLLLAQEYDYFSNIGTLK
ncbi:TPA: hypothetical protein U1319_001995 [Streptococcus suis]|nr:hypothetical protein [Streptococcus suis]